MYKTLSLTVIFCAIHGRNVLGYSTGPPTTACRDMVPRHGVIAQNTPAPFLVEVSKTRYSPNERLFVRIRGCRNNRFKGFYIQPRLAQYPNAAVFLGTFGRVGGTQYTCDENGGVLTHVDPSEKEYITLIWMAPPRLVGHIIFRVTFVQSYTKFWVGVNSPVVSDGISTELGIMESFALQTPTDSVCLPTAVISVSRPSKPNKLLPVIPRTFAKLSTTPKLKTTTTTEKKFISKPTIKTMRQMTTTSTSVYITTSTLTHSTTVATTKHTASFISIPTTVSIASVKPTIIKYSPNTTTGLTPTDMSNTANTQTMTAEITRPTAVPTINETSGPVSMTPTRLITTTEPLTTEMVHIPTTGIDRTKRVVTTTSKKSSLTPIPVTQMITRTTVKYLNTTASAFYQAGALKLSPNIRCGSLHGCFDDCEGEICTFVVAWQYLGTRIQFEVKKMMDTAADIWVAVGFSDDRKMGEEFVIECISEFGVVKVYESYNMENYRNVRSEEPSVGLYDEHGAVQDGIFRCSFTKESKAKTKGNLDFQHDWYLMFASGKTIQGMKLPHDFTVIPPVSEIKVDFQKNPPMHLKYNASTTKADSKESNGPAIQQAYIARDTECGIRRSCFQSCNSLDCQFVVTWDRRDDHVIFKMKAVTLESTNQWIAVAFSDDDKMGGDSVIQCVSDERNIIRVKQSYNKGRNNFEIINATKGIYNVQASFIDGILSCEFARDRIIHEEPEIFNLDQKWKLLFAQGRSKRGYILPHDMMRKPQTSEDWVDFGHEQSVVLSAPLIYIKIHSCLMIFTWCFAASISTILGRYFQPVYQGDTVFVSKSWLKVHRLFVVTTVLGFITGLVIIFVGVEGISTVLKEDISSFKRVHPVLGLLVTFLALLCPILLIFRPKQGTTSLSIFNWIFWLVESITLVLAVVTVFAGLKSSEGSIPHYLEYLIIGYAVYQVLTTMIFESIRCYDVQKEKEKKMEYLYELYVKPWSLTRHNSWTSALSIHETRKGVKKSILGTNILILAVFVLSCIIIIVRA